MRTGQPRRARGELAADVLAALWATPTGMTAGEVLDKLGGDLAYSTVVTILSRLHAKGTLDREPHGRAFSYRPVTDRPGLAARRMRQVLDAETNRQQVLAQFVSALSDEEERELFRLLHEHQSPAAPQPRHGTDES